MRLKWLALLAVAIVPPSVKPTTIVVSRTISYEERVSAQRAIERVYWNHRLWPGAPVTGKPPLDAVVSDAELRAKVDDYLGKSNALERLWARPIGPRELQAEVDRMVSHSRAPGILREIFAALGNDPVLIAETLARPSLADRLIRNWYAYDSRFHRGVRQAAEAALARSGTAAGLRSSGADYHESTISAQAGNPGSGTRRPFDQAGVLDPGEWSEHLDAIASGYGTTRDRIPLGRFSGLQEGRERFFASAVLRRSNETLTLATVTWAKSPFDTWWSETRAGIGTRLTVDASAYSVSPPSGAACADDTWDIRQYVPEARTGHTAVWTGTEMIVWGGLEASGSRYNPATDTWAPISSGSDTPSPRERFTSAWTGTEMIVWGGRDRNTAALLNSGARYNPTSDRWIATSLGPDVPSPRWYHTAIWTGSRMIVWGGEDEDDVTNSGGVYSPVTDTWNPTSTSEGVPEPRLDHTSVWTGTEMIVWGGTGGPNIFDTGGRYDPSNDTWLRTSTGAHLPMGRYVHSAVWDGTRMLVWGGRDGSGLINSGGRYTPSTDVWDDMSADASTPEARSGHSAVWSGTEMVVWGGGGEFPEWLLSSGGRYDPVSDSWRSTSNGANTPGRRVDQTAVWTGSEMIVFGGYTSDNAPARTGGRYDPVSDSWVPTSTGANAPIDRTGHSAVWTGAEMIIWGGSANFWQGQFEPPGVLASGARYDAATDNWAPTVDSGSVLARTQHTAVWTGVEMIVWGGVYNGGYLTNEGGRYDPLLNRWTLTSSASGTPSRRAGHTAVWTDAEMIVWGGSTELGRSNTGGRYNPSSNSWRATSLGPGVPSARDDHSAVWTGSEMIIWGGNDPNFQALATGARYDPSVDRWHATVGLPDPSAGRRYHTAVWTGSEMIVWGGTSGWPPLDTGEKYSPVSDSWESIPGGIPAPGRRTRHTAIWTGAEMLVWGGEDGMTLNTGGRYAPTTGNWRATALDASVASPRTGHTTVWTGDQIIVWGGSAGTSVWLYCAARCAQPMDSYPDRDGDGYGDGHAPTPGCAGALPEGHVTDGTDCDDEAGSIHPGAPERCDAVDNDCDTAIDEGFDVAMECEEPVDACYHVVGTLTCLADGSGVQCAGDQVLHDATPPALSLTAGPAVLWPPDHRMVPVRVEWETQDQCDSAPSVTLVGVTSSEDGAPARGFADGSPESDIEGADLGTADHEVLLRAERSPSGPGREYRLTYRAVDQAGNETTVTVQVSVPHDRADAPKRSPRAPGRPQRPAVSAAPGTGEPGLLPARPRPPAPASGTTP